MNNKYVAVILNKVFIRENLYLYTFNRVEVGEYDEEDAIFYDRNDNEYYSMKEKEIIYSELPYAFGTVIEMSELRKAYQQSNDEESYITINEAIKRLNRDSMDIVYTVSIREDIENYDEEIEEDFEEDKEIDEDDNDVIIAALNLGSIQEQAENITKEQELAEQEEDAYQEALANGELPPDLVKLISDVVTGEYSLRELKDMRKQISYNYENLESVLDSLDLQIEASESGKSYVELPKDGDEENKKQEAKESVIDEQIGKVVELKPEFLDIEDLYNKITQTIIAQDEQVRRMLIEIARMEMPNHKKNGILITGPSGVGKTLLMSLVAKYINKPFLQIDSTQLTIPGYVGKDIEEYLWDLYVSCGKDIKKAENAIIFFDEIDKKGSSNKSDVSGKGVLNILLKFLDGTTYQAAADLHSSKNTVKINTSNMIVILGGAFTDVYKHLNDKRNIGFGKTNIERIEATMEDFVEKAMMPDELMGRLPIIIRMNELTKDDLMQIILKSDDSALVTEMKAFQELGIDLEATEGYLNAIVEKAFMKKTGARGINSIINETTWKIFDEVYRNVGKYDKAILVEETANDNSNYQLIKKK